MYTSTSSGGGRFLICFSVVMYVFAFGGMTAVKSAFTFAIALAATLPTFEAVLVVVPTCPVTSGSVSPELYVWYVALFVLPYFVPSAMTSRTA